MDLRDHNSYILVLFLMVHKLLVFVHHHTLLPYNHLMVNFLIMGILQIHNPLIFFLNLDDYKNISRTYLTFHVPFNWLLEISGLEKVKGLIHQPMFLFLFCLYILDLINYRLLEILIFYQDSLLLLYQVVFETGYLYDNIRK